MTEALRRLGLDLPASAPALYDGLRGPAAADALEALRAAVAPMPLPEELEVFLRAHDGQALDADWWPTLDCGPLLSCDDIVAFLGSMRATAEPWQWSVAWIPVAHEQWYQAAVDAVPERSGTVIDASWPDPPRSVAPTLAHAIDAVVDLGRAGLLIPTAEVDRVARLERDAFLDELWRDAWTGNLLAPRAEIDPAGWPDAWGGPQSVA
jgi:hypothetical protein